MKMDDSASPRGKPKDKTVAEIEKLAKQRANRRKSAEAFKRKRQHEIRENEKKGKPGDVDFQRMIRRFRKYDMCIQRPHADTPPPKINVVVRKRPVSESEIRRKDYDSVSCSNPRVYVHHCKLKVDGITKYLDNTQFELDHTFHESSTNDEVYAHTAKHLVQFAANGGRGTCFAYGQTGSGKTYTMAGVQGLAAGDVFRLVRSPEHSGKQLMVHCAFFELYGGRCVDLLHNRRVCSIREDGKGVVQVEGLQEILVSDESELLDLIERGNSARTTHATEMNTDSSRSHAICQIAFRKLTAREGSEPYGKLSLIDLAGSERGQDTKHHSRQRRVESAEINKSLLSLKECIRALDNNSSHVPYRASKLTMILKDSFNSNAKTVMIGCVSPIASSADHTLNTIRYADRVKEKKATRPSSAENNNNNNKVQQRNYDDSSLDSGSDFEEYSDQKEQDDSDAPIPAKYSLPPPPVAATKTPVKSNALRSPGRTPAKRVPVSSSAVKARKDVLTENNRKQKDNFRSKIVQPRQRKQWDDPVADPLERQEQQRAPLRTSNTDNINNTNSKKVPEELNFQDVVSALVDEEEALLSAHMKAIQKNADLLTEEGVLLSKVQGIDVVDYDIEEYAERLDGILTSKIAMFNNLHGLLKQFRRHLALEEVSSS
mmetsp:Transcript_31595/g.50424  ORF Transcript_31595/g.50424 Transcript_31595/m.50424 type:complete len:658 (-) Transcript_31595:3760-5733(-)